jgi:hypothetical protein
VEWANSAVKAAVGWGSGALRAAVFGRKDESVLSQFVEDMKLKKEAERKKEAAKNKE